MVSGVEAEIPYEQAKETVYQAVAPLGAEYQAIIRQALDNRWIDVYENVGKRSGGYMSGALVHPYILLNYQDDLDSMFTLAHELGHAVHSYLSNRTQPTVYRDYVIFVAEVASTCNEALLMETSAQAEPTTSAAGPGSSTTSWSSLRAPCTARPCSRSLNCAWASWWLRARP